MQLISGGSVSCCLPLQRTRSRSRCAAFFGRLLFTGSSPSAPLSSPKHLQSTGSSSLFAHLHGQSELAAPLIRSVSPQVSAAFSLAALVVHSLHHHASRPAHCEPHHTSPDCPLISQRNDSKRIAGHPLQGMGRRQPTPLDNLVVARIAQLGSACPCR